MGGDDKSVVTAVYNTIVPDLDILPDAAKIDRMVDGATLASYSLTAFAVSGTLLFSMRIGRELVAWRSLARYRKLLKKRLEDGAAKGMGSAP